MGFDLTIGTFFVWVTLTGSECFFFRDNDELVEFLIHKDGAKLTIDKQDLINQLNDANRWTKDVDGNYLAWNIQVGFRKVSIVKAKQGPTL